jgi:Transcriptional regulator, AbiEi antitoxin
VPNGRQRALTNLLETERTLFTGQLGLATRAQVLGRGMTDAQIRNAITQGRWLRTAPGLYALGTWPPAPARRLLAACLMTGGVASHASAVWLWGLLVDEPTYVSVSLPRGQRANVPTPRGRWQGSHGGLDLSTLVIHQSSDLFPPCISNWHGVPTTNPLRSLVDLAAVASPESLDEALDVALATRLVTAEGLWLKHPACAGPGVRAQLN